MRSSHAKFVSTLRKAKDEKRWVFVMSRFGPKEAEVHNFTGVIAEVSDGHVVVAGELAELRFPLDRNGTFEYVEFSDVLPSPAGDYMKQVVQLEYAATMRSEKLKATVQVGLGKLNTKPIA